MSRYGIFAFHFLDGSTAGIDFNLTATVFTAQQIIIIGFQPSPANLGDTGNTFLPLQSFHIFFVDLPDIAEYLCSHRIIRVIADWLDIDRYTGQVIAPFFYPCDDILGQILGQDGRFKGIFSLVDFFLQLLFRYIEQFCQGIQFGIGYALFRRDISNHKAGTGTDENLAIAVVHDATHSRYGNSTQAVSFCQPVVIAAFKQLQIDQAANQGSKDKNDNPVQIAEPSVLVLFFH